MKRVGILVEFNHEDLEVSVIGTLYDVVNLCRDFADTNNTNTAVEKYCH